MESLTTLSIKLLGELELYARHLPCRNSRLTVMDIAVSRLHRLLHPNFRVGELLIMTVMRKGKRSLPSYQEKE